MLNSTHLRNTFLTIPNILYTYVLLCPLSVRRPMLAAVAIWLSGGTPATCGFIGICDLGTSSRRKLRCAFDPLPPSSIVDTSSSMMLNPCGISLETPVSAPPPTPCSVDSPLLEQITNWLLLDEANKASFVLVDVASRPVFGNSASRSVDALQQLAYRAAICR